MNTKTGLSLLFLLLMFTAHTMQAQVAINSENFPDDNFRNYLLKQDYGSDALISEEEIQNIKSFYLKDLKIKSLEGIGYFSALEELNCRNNALGTLDLSHNIKLKTLDCEVCQLTSLDISKNTELQSLNCSLNPLTTLDIQSQKIEELYCYTTNLSTLNVPQYSELKRLDCSYCNLETLDVSNNTELQYLSCSGNQLTTLDASNCLKLEELYCKENLLHQLNISGCTALMGLDCQENQLTSLDISGMPKMMSLQCYDNMLTSLNVSKNTALEGLYCANNLLSSLDVSKSLALLELSCSNNPISSLNISKNINLRKLECNNNQLAELDIAKNIDLRGLECDNNQLTELDIAMNTKLESLSCSNNELTTLDLSKNPELYFIDFSGNRINDTGMDDLIESLQPCMYSGSGNRNFLYVINRVDAENEENICTTEQVAKCNEKGWRVFAKHEAQLGNNRYEGSDPNAIVAITKRNFPDTQFILWLLKQDYGKDGALTAEEIESVTEMDIEKYSNIRNLQGIEFFSNLKTLIFNRYTGEYDVLAETLDLSKNTKLKCVDVSGNLINSLNISGCSELETLKCAYNQISQLDLSNNPELTHLQCQGNLLYTLDLSQNKSLELLSCYENYIDEDNMESLVESLPIVNSGQFYVYSDIETEGNVCTVEQVNTAKSKGWVAYCIYDDTYYKEYEGSVSTEIDTVKTNDMKVTNTPRHNISGQRVNSGYKGIVIQNGKKLLVK